MSCPVIDNGIGGDSLAVQQRWQEEEEAGLLTRLSLRGFPSALVRQIPLSASPLAIFIHKHLAPKKDIKPGIQPGVNIIFAQC